MSEINANLAEMLLNNNAFGDAVQEIKQDLINNWINADTVESREEIHKELRGLLLIQRKLTVVVENERMKQELEEEKAEFDKRNEVQRTH